RFLYDNFLTPMAKVCGIDTVSELWELMIKSYQKEFGKFLEDIIKNKEKSEMYCLIKDESNLSFIDSLISEGLFTDRLSALTAIMIWNYGLYKEKILPKEEK
ncbi:MAG: hypothetical protein GYA51_02985, partial [Candidatus Methanofastidiosa archaeon]|nr:hypothetical protein [Candidatus Methanofastidiosa archaeon]